MPWIDRLFYISRQRKEMQRMQSTADSYCAPTYRRWRSVKYWIDILPIVRLMDDSWVEWTIDVILDKRTRFLYPRRCSDGLGDPQRDGAGTKFWSKEKYPEREWNGGGGRKSRLMGRVHFHRSVSEPRNFADANDGLWNSCPHSPRFLVRQ